VGRPGEFRSAVASVTSEWQASIEVGSSTFYVDEPAEEGGGGTGLSPTGYFLGSLASCYALAVSWAARKRGVSIANLRVRATGRYGEFRFDALTLHVSADLTEQELQPLLRMASRVCWVTKTLEDPPTVEIEAGTVPEK
jgi:putative redox protein